MGIRIKLATDHPYAKALGYAIDTGVDMDLMVGSDGDTNHFGGIIDELRIYDRGLSSDEIMSIALDGTVRFTTSAIPQPPTVEILEITPDYNGTAVIKGILTGKDENLPVVSVYFGRTDAGFNQAGWEHNATVNGGIPVGLGEFNASVSGLIPGETYYFRTFAQSADGIDWSSGAPEVSLDLLAYWRMDESNGSSLDDSFYPFYNAEIKGLDIDGNRSLGYMGNGFDLDGWSNFIDLDSSNSGFLNTSFDERSFTAWIKPESNFYAGPAIQSHDFLAAYYQADEGAGTTLSDLSVNQINSTLLGGTSWAAGKYGQSVSLDGINDKVEINPESSLMNLHKSSYSISMWINPADPSPGKYTKNRLAVRGYRVAMSDSYFTNLPSIYNLPSSGSSFFTGGPGGRGFDFQSDSDFISAGTGVGNDNYMVLFTGSFQAKASGDYNWEILGNDDRGALWIDLDQNGIFELNGNQGDERVLDAANGFANTSTTLSPGFYRIALIHGEKTGSSSQQLKFSTPSIDAGPMVLTHVKPDDPAQDGLFVTENDYTLLQRDSIGLTIDGNYTLRFQHSTHAFSTSVYSNQLVNENTWSHVGVVVNYEDDSIDLYLNGSLVGQETLPEGIPVDLTLADKWLLGGTNPVEGDFFKGGIDDLRFYSKALSGSEIAAISLDDLTGADIAGYSNQIIYDEGSEISGLTLALEDGVLNAKVSQKGSSVELSSGSPIPADEWQHIAVSYGESPKSLKLFLNGQLVDGPEILNGGATISSQGKDLLLVKKKAVQAILDLGTTKEVLMKSESMQKV